MRLLAIGDTHIPRRASEIPYELKRLIESEKFDLILCTGDLTDRKILEYLERLSEVKIVRGNMDHLPFPEKELVEVKGVKIGLIHGDQVYPRGNRKQLKGIAKKLDADILVSGHTHSPDIHYDEVLLLNPGSATGVWGGGGGSLRPSLLTIDIKGREVDVTLFELEKELLSHTEKFRL